MKAQVVRATRDTMTPDAESSAYLESTGRFLPLETTFSLILRVRSQMQMLRSLEDRVGKVEQQAAAVADTCRILNQNNLELYFALEE
ncbi:hypothetical protein SS50377_22876 [Spironucleus salmonicida]|uniref:Uncharacterized protein n=1 Tax=Spironucleus salmonicida TaxID=348837 RepID=V6LWX3_9EUKA|nr:hypothetical protein SS50377_22876 [Spironucleus salmonicida]|eukprot:EST48728.1 Hypothetical protein SS50377_11045 [Spironucleus salmonicida]